MVHSDYVWYQLCSFLNFLAFLENSLCSMQYLLWFEFYLFNISNIPLGCYKWGDKETTQAMHENDRESTRQAKGGSFKWRKFESDGVNE